MISPEKIPTFTGDLVELHREVISLRQAAKAISEHGDAVHTRFQHLDAFYKAPEAGQLFATTQAVQHTSSGFGDKLNAVAGALETYMVKAAEIVKQLETLREQARVFVESVKGHDSGIHTWRSDPDKVAEHKAIWDGVNAAVAAFEQAEVTCADKITALVGGTQWHINNGKPSQQNAYGFSAGQLAQADSLPWGRPEHEEMLPFGIDYHLKQAGISLWDNAKGSVTGLIDLFSPGDDGNATREGLVRVIAGAEGYLLDPYGDHNTHLGPASDQLMEDSKPYAKQFAKSFVAWDDWQTNPGKAFGTVLFNGLTLASGPLGAASRAGAAAGEASAVARVAGTVAKVGEVLDPIGAATKAVGVAARTLPKVSDLVSGVRAATEAATTADKAHSFLRLSDGSHLQISDGEFIPGKHGVTDTTPAPHEPAANDRVPSVQAPREHELVAAGARTNGVANHVGDEPTPGTGHHAHASTGDSNSPQPSTHEGTATGSGGAHGSDSGPHASGEGAGFHDFHDAGLPEGPDQPHGHGDPGTGGGESSHEKPPPHAGETDFKEIVRRQVEKANNNKAWFDKYYRSSDGHRHSTRARDENGNPLPIIRHTDPDDPSSPWTADRTPREPATFESKAPRIGHPSTVAHDHLKDLNDLTARRNHAVARDLAAKDDVLEAKEAHKVHNSPETEAALKAAKEVYKPIHVEMRDAAEALGEKAAELHAITDRYPGAKKAIPDELLRGPGRLDQIWHWHDRMVVVEAKGSSKTDLGDRVIAGGRRVEQGHPEYLDAILDEMRQRGGEERKVAKQLRRALAAGKLDYILVKAKPEADKYGGYLMWDFKTK
ncbi:hypothetical protein AB5J72_05925 [Streptomyces sp. CG1]|uniref:hypothetical protein n=1 Tax=Streptomyces sp. CG1 TaxID=1287523 RepID=UPI0034E2066C